MSSSTRPTSVQLGLSVWVRCGLCSSSDQTVRSQLHSVCLVPVWVYSSSDQTARSQLHSVCLGSVWVYSSSDQTARSQLLSVCLGPVWVYSSSDQTVVPAALQQPSRGQARGLDSDSHIGHRAGSRLMIAEAVIATRLDAIRHKTTALNALYKDINGFIAPALKLKLTSISVAQRYFSAVAAGLPARRWHCSRMRPACVNHAAVRDLTAAIVGELVKMPPIEWRQSDTGRLVQIPICARYGHLQILPPIRCIPPVRKSS